MHRHGEEVGGAIVVIKLTTTSPTTLHMMNLGMNAHAPKYDLAVNPPYMINYRAKRCGKTITASKRRVTFQFGFSSADAIRDGKIEADARGEEHEIVLIWSHITGKRELFMDGRQIHTSKAARGNTKFEHSWSISGNHVLKLTAHGAAPLSASCTAEGARQFRQFDLELDGMSYFDMAKIYELGTKSLVPNPRKVDGDRFSKSLPALTMMPINYSYRGAAYNVRDEDDDDEEEKEQRQPPQDCLKVNTMIDLFDQMVVSQPTVTPTSMSMISPMSSSIPSLYGMPTNSFSSTSNGYYDEFAPVAAPPQGKMFDTTNILSAYSQEAPSYQPAEPIVSTALVCTSEQQMAPSVLGLRNLVNLDDLNYTPSMQQASARSMMSTAPSQPMGRAPTLSEIHRHQHDSSPTIPARPVFNKFQSLPNVQQLPQQAVGYNNGYVNQGQQQAPAYGYGNQQQQYGQSYGY